MVALPKLNHAAASLFFWGGPERSEGKAGREAELLIANLSEHLNLDGEIY